MGFTILFLFALLHWACAATVHPCETITKIAGCIECLSSSKQCFMCHRDRWPVFNVTTAKIKACKVAARAGAACAAFSGDSQCAKCDGSGFCYQCSAGKYFDARYNCAPDTKAAASCKQLSKNPDCAACNPDGTCKLCSLATRVLVPLNAIYINMPGAESQCLTASRVRAEGLDLTGAPITLPPYCREVTTDFRCARCADGFSYSAAAKKCIKFGQPGSSGCTPAAAPGLKYREYCSKCGRNAAGKVVCKECTWGRSLDAAGDCSLNCKRLFGISCLKCTASACTAIDPAYRNGRR